MKALKVLVSDDVRFGAWKSKFKTKDSAAAWQCRSSEPHV